MVTPVKWTIMNVALLPVLIRPHVMYVASPLKYHDLNEPYILLSQDVQAGFICECAEGYTGTTCDQDITDCTADSCDMGTCHVSCA